LLIKTICESDFIESKKINGSNSGRLKAINITSTLIEFKKCFESLKEKLSGGQINSFSVFLEVGAYSVPWIDSTSMFKDQFEIDNSKLIELFANGGGYGRNTDVRIVFDSVEPNTTLDSETLLPLALELFHNKSIKLDKLIASMTCNPAKILEINKGTLDIGNDADLCLLDINKPWVVKQSELKSKSKNTPIESRKMQGQIMKTFGFNNLYNLIGGISKWTGQKNKN
jgi:hypothetical protein